MTAWNTLPILALLFAATHAVERIDINYTRLYTLDGREARGLYSDKRWPGAFEIMRSPWEGVGGYGTESDSFGLDDFVLVWSDSTGADVQGGVCAGISRVQVPQRMDRLNVSIGTGKEDMLPDRTIRPWIRTEAYLGQCKKLDPAEESDLPKGYFPGSLQHDRVSRSTDELVANPEQSMLESHLDGVAGDADLQYAQHSVVVLGDVGSPGGSGMPGTVDDLLLVSGSTGHAALLELGQGPLMGKATYESSQQGGGANQDVDMGFAVGVHRIPRVAASASSTAGLQGRVQSAGAIGDVNLDGSPDVLMVSIDKNFDFNLLLLTRNHSQLASARVLYRTSAMGSTAAVPSQLTGGLEWLADGHASRDAPPWHDSSQC